MSEGETTMEDSEVQETRRHSQNSDDFMMETSSEEEVTLTPFELCQKIEKAWQNERLSPELLPPIVEESELMMEQINTMKQNVELLDKKNDFRYNLHLLEVDRLRFILVDYLRTRLKKIDAYPWAILAAEDRRKPSVTSILSKDEKKYAQEYMKNIEGHFFGAAIRNVPGPLSKTRPKPIPIPNLDTFVFVQFNKDLPRMTIEDVEGRLPNIKY